MNLGKKEQGVPDFVLLEHLTEDELYETMRTRFHNDNIYTYIGDVVISVNPFKKMDFYKQSDIQDYRGRYKYERTPHIYALANDAYRTLLSNKQDQCIIISGESGAGKTEASKIIMQYITTVSKSSDRAESIKQAFIESNPVLEAFGNAKTLRNDNSSRFGKYMEMQFSITGAPVGGSITNYLLEKSRVVTRAEGERSFHIFYQMLHGLPKPKLEELKLKKKPEDYHYIGLSKCTKVPSIDDVAEYAAVTKAMGVFGLKEAEVDAIWRVLAAILHIGDVTFVDNKDGTVKLSSPDALAAAAFCLKIKREELERGLTRRSISVDVQKQPTVAQKQGDKIDVPFDLIGASFARDALAKALYDRLFQYIVETINKTIKTTTNRRDYQVIGILDIYGFEIFEKNSFEQLNINYCNEKLQQLFIELTLKSEQEEYQKQGIEWTQIDYFNNKTICDLIESKPIGIISLMDEEGLMGGSSDQSLLDKFNYHFSKHAHFQTYSTTKDRSIPTTSFRLKHYAGDVTYDMTGMMDKNKDSFFNTLINLLCGSALPLVKQLFEPMQKVDSKKRPESAGLQFRNAMNQLIQTLLTCNPHYVRCIKPNDNKRAGDLNEERTRHQIRYLGLLENVRVRRAGFANRQDFTNFYNRYKMLCKETWPNFRGNLKKDIDKAVAAILKEIEIKPEEFRLGKTKIFIRNPKTLFALEEKRDAGLARIATIIQKIFRGYRARQFYKKLLATVTLQVYIKLYRTRQHYDLTRHAFTIQKTFKAWKERSQWLRRKSAIKILLCYRKSMFRRWIENLIPEFANVKTDPYWGKYIDWPANPVIIKNVVPGLKADHERWRVRKMIKSLNPAQTVAMKQKIEAYDLFHEKKPWSFGRAFMGDYLAQPDNTARPKYQQAVQSALAGQPVLFSDLVFKISTKGDVDKRYIAVTEGHIHTFKPRNWQLRDSIPLTDIEKISMTPAGNEASIVLHMKKPATDNLFNFTAAGRPFETLSEFVTVVSSALKRRGPPPPLGFTDRIEFNNSKKPKVLGLTVVANPQAKQLTYKAKGDAAVLTFNPTTIPNGGMVTSPSSPAIAAPRG